MFAIVARVPDASGSGSKGWRMSDSVREAAHVLRGQLASFDPEHLSAEDCASLADELALTEKACAAARLLAVRRAAGSGLHRQRGFGDPISWFARQGGTTTSQAREALQTASGLDGCEQTKQALLAGEVSIAQAREITAAEAEFPGQEHELLAAAKGGDLSGLRAHVRDRRLARMAPVDLHRRQHAARRFRHWRDGLGMVCFEGALPPETGLPLVSRIEHLARKHRTAARRDGRPPERFEAYAADALASFASDPSGDGARRAKNAELVMVCDLFAYRRGHAHATEPCHIVDGGPVPVEVVRDFAQDAFIKAVLHDGVRIHTVKHFGRRLPAELRSALDLGPVPRFAGRQCVDCGRRYGLEYDHVDPVANNGVTSYDNIVARCYPDHQAKTERDRKAGRLGARQRRARAPVKSRAGPGS